MLSSCTTLPSHSPHLHNLTYLYFPPAPLQSLILYSPHCKPSPFGKQFCLAYTAIFPSYIPFQNNQQKIFNPKQMWINEILICTFGENKNFTFVHCLFASPTSAYAFLYSI
jgi:hypothetical protein